MDYSPMLTDSNFGVIILCPSALQPGLNTTVNSLKSHFPDVTYIAMVGNEKSDIKPLERYCRVYHGGKTITSLIDEGMKQLKTEWRLVVMAGSRVRYNVLKKYKTFIKSEKVILYPVIDKKYLFHEASINGIMMHKKAYEDIGGFGDDLTDLCEAKLIWAGKALDKEYKFVALVGLRIQ